MTWYLGPSGPYEEWEPDDAEAEWTNEDADIRASLPVPADVEAEADAQYRAMQEADND